MAVRTTEELVAGVIEVDEDITLTPFISAASSLVDRVSAYAAENDLLQDDEDGKSRSEKLEEIETWLAAHFYTVRDPRTTQEGAGPVSASYQSRVDLRLFTSHYGQMAAALDETGVLERINSGANGSRARTARATWVGKTPAEMAGEE
jgi:hypothetical protein